jgi:hypothetical protein
MLAGSSAESIVIQAVYGDNILAVLSFRTLFVSPFNLKWLLTPRIAL